MLGARKKKPVSNRLFARVVGGALLGWLSGWGCFRLVELAAAGIGHLNHGPADFKCFKVATALRAHDAFALNGRSQQGLVASPDAGGPCSSIAKLGRTGCTGRVASSALGFEHLFTGLELAIGVSYFYCANFLDPRCSRLFHVDSAGRGLFVRSDKVDQADDGENGDHKREENGQQQLLWVFDGTGVVLIVCIDLAGVAHGVLKKICCPESTHDYSRHPSESTYNLKRELRL